MFPAIFQTGPLKIYSYGLMLAISAIVCTLLLSRAAEVKGIKKDIIVDLMFWMVVSGVMGARIFYIFLNWSYFIKDPLEMIMIQHGGLAWQGGLIGAGLVGLWFIKKHHLPLWSTLDLVAPYIALGQSIGRIGCFFNGCCYGKPVGWGIYFPVHGERLHPTQLYESVGLLLIFLILKYLQKTNQKSGRIFIFYLLMSSMLRFINEFFRADHVNIFFGLSIFQIVCLGIFSAGLILSLKFKKN